MIVPTQSGDLKNNQPIQLPTTATAIVVPILQHQPQNSLGPMVTTTATLTTVPPALGQPLPTLSLSQSSSSSPTLTQIKSEHPPLYYNYNYPATLLNLDTYQSQSVKTRPKWNESAEARERRLQRNAERMREKRAKESELEYRERLARNAEANRIRRQNETEVQRALRLMRNAARQRLRRASESPEERQQRLAKSAERMREVRASTPKVDKPPLADRLKGY